MNLHNRQIVERIIVRYLIEKAIQYGWSVMVVNDGEDVIKIDRTEEATKNVFDQVADVVFSVDESRIKFARYLICPDSQDSSRVSHTVLIVLGNDGHDCLADHSLNSNYPGDNFEEMMGQVYEFCSQFEELQ